MSPRKKSKPNSKAPASGIASELDSSKELPPSCKPVAPETNEATPKPLSKVPTTGTLVTTNSTATSDSKSSRKDQNNKPGRKWYGSGGSWRSKAPPVAQIAKESIGVAGGATSELVIEGAKAVVNSPTKFLSKRRSSKGDPIAASMTKLNVTSSSLVDRPEESQAIVDAPEDAPPGTLAQPGTEAPKEPTVEPPKGTESDPPLPPDPPKLDVVEKKDKTDAQEQSTNASGWRSWWSIPDGYGTEANKTKDAMGNIDTTAAQKTPLPGSTPLEDPTGKAKTLGDATHGQAVTAESRVDKPTELTENSKDAAQTKGEGSITTYDKGTPSRSWFGLRSNTQNAQTNPTTTQSTTSSSQSIQKSNATAELSDPHPATAVTAPVANTPADDSKKASTKPEASKPSGWAFWSRDKPQSNESTDPNATHKQVGELAVADTPSQSAPEAAQFNEQESSHQKEPTKSIHGRPRSKEIFSKSSTPAKTSRTNSPAPAAAAPQPAPKQALTPKTEPANLILPEFRSTYHLAQKPSYWQQIRQYFLGGELEAPHLYIAPSPPQIKKAIAIGVHGYFPAPLLQKVLGQPTGTSIRFANAAAAAIQEWTEARGYSAEIEKVALEGEGFIADRVSTLWKLLLNWIEHIKSADFILVACHSQGVPVAIMLVAKLIQFGCVNAARIGVCAMAGVNLGPFPEYRTRYLGGTAAELFEFSQPTSIVSQMYLGALEEVLQYGVRIVYIGSIDDQLVSLESSTFSNIAHPYIYRAVFVDGRIHAPDFITHLVGFALKLRNLGLPDHGLIRELSPALAGSLYSGEGHSRIYEDPKVYNLAVSHALETTSLPIPTASNRPVASASIGTSKSDGLAQSKSDGLAQSKIIDRAGNAYALKVKEYGSVGSGNQNPYFLPWAMRGLLEEDFVKRELGQEVEELLGLFETWRPVGKGLKDVRFRLEAVKSKL
ncbi:hypothetical protein AOQ84DRAFT_361871 [Glonium stellatum]|uniref:YMC020W-like alpha/beta hydrolase domain-containing protein n=1 Tax=Glonium stellatum TaxID=574774 RepID=A0A8E2F5Q8_9PEZI|nr:hypothetical protein AOQ84DRAFT_361871 [Glonium stellatum]